MDWSYFDEIGRSERIRTSDPLIPNQVRYQAALRSDIHLDAEFPREFVVLKQDLFLK